MWLAEYHDAVIIGGGPAGLTAGLYLMRAGIDAVLLEKGFPGGAPLNTDRVENYPGFPEGISGRELMERFSGQAKAFGLPIREFASADKVSLSQGRFLIETSAGAFESMGIIVAAGTEPVKMGIPGETEFIGRGISYCATCDGLFFRDLDVAVIGGGDSAIEEALSLANVVGKVYIIHRRDSLRAQKILQDRAFKNSKVEILWNKKPLEIGGGAEVDYMVLEDTKTGAKDRLDVKGVFIYVGYKANTEFLGDLVDRNEAGFVITDNNLAVKTAGIYIAGDIRRKTLRQISTAVGDGALAAVNMEKYILERK